MKFKPFQHVCVVLLLGAATVISVVTAQDSNVITPPCNWLDCVDQPVPPPPYAQDSPYPSPTDYATASPEDYPSPVPSPVDYPSPLPSPVDIPSPMPSPVVDPLPASPVDIPSTLPSPVDPAATQNNISYSPEAAVITQPLSPAVQPPIGGPLCSDPAPDPSPVNKLAKWCEIDAAKLYFKPKAVKPRYFPGTPFEEGYGSPQMNETRLKLEYYGAEGRYVLNAAYDSGDDKPYSSVQLDLTLGLMKIMPFAFNHDGRPQAVLMYDLRTLDPSFFVALSTRDGFKSAFAPVSEAFEFLDRIVQRFQAPYNPSPDIAMPMQRSHYCPEWASVSLYLREIRGAVGL